MGGSEATTELLQKRTVSLKGPMDETQATTIIAQLLFLEHEDPEAQVCIEIDSPGGTVVAGLAILDTMRDLRPPIQTLVVRAAKGMAAWIAASVTSGMRSAKPSATFSIEPLVSSQPGPILEELKHELAQRLATVSGQPVAVTLQDLAIGRSFGVDEARDYGLLDQIVP